MWGLIQDYKPGVVAFISLLQMKFLNKDEITFLLQNLEITKLVECGLFNTSCLVCLLFCIILSLHLPLFLNSNIKLKNSF